MAILMLHTWKKRRMQCHRDITKWHNHKWQVTCSKWHWADFWFCTAQRCRLQWKMGRGRRLSVCYQSSRRMVILDAPTPAGFLTQLLLLDDRHLSPSMFSVSEASSIQKSKCCPKFMSVTWRFLLPTDPPSVTLSVQPQTVTEGAKVRFICSASANPEITGYRYPSFNCSPWS